MWLYMYIEYMYTNEAEPGMVVHIYNTRTWEERQENCKFEASLSYVVSPCLKKGQGSWQSGLNGRLPT
jgi:hypothetical protein